MDPKALYNITYGLYLVSSKDGGKFNAQVANTVIQVCSEPMMISVTLNKKNLTHEFVVKSGLFGVSILSKDTPLSFIGDFGFKSGRDLDKFSNVKYKISESGLPLITDNTVACLEARVTGQFDLPTHTTFAGSVIGAEVIREGEPITYAYYQQVKRGTTPKSAPSYIEIKKEVIPAMPKYKCTLCGYIYDPERGDPDSGIKPGTPFEKLPDNWVCPVCGAEKSMFEKM